MTEITPESAPNAEPVPTSVSSNKETGTDAAAVLQDESHSVPMPGETVTESAGTDTADDAVPAVIESITDIEEDGVALHIMEPHTAGTILVAVAEPTDMFYDQVPPCESESFRTEWQAASPAEHSEAPVRLHGGIPRYDDLVEVAAVRLGGLGPALFFTANGVSCEAGDTVIVSMEEGQAFGNVASVMRVNPGHLDGASGDDGKIRPLVRKATEKDASSAETNRALAAEALEYCRECVGERDLDMKLVDVLILHDRSKMVFYFTAPARIDFRELVKDLVRRYRTRIELRQIGVRHETQMVGALGNCGMVCCCRRYLRKFAPVAIKMAKEQNVFLNPVKISGICGRLLCCLAYEQEHYDEFYRSCPKLGKKYHTDAGVVRVLRASLFRESVTVLSEAGEEVEYALAEWNTLNPFRPNAQQQGQISRKQEAPGNEGRQRKGGGRNSRGPQDGQEAFADDADTLMADAGDMAEDEVESTVFFAMEERIIATERGDGVAVERNAGMTAVVTDLEPEDMDDDADDDEGGSIFGLAPGRSASVSDGNAEKTAQREGGARRRRPRRRKQRSGA